MSASSTPRAFLTPSDLAFLEPISRLFETSPFDPAWVELEREAIRIGGICGKPDPHSCVGVITENLCRLAAPLEVTLAGAAANLREGGAATARQLGVYKGAAIYMLFKQAGPHLQRLIDANAVDVPFYDELAELHHLLFAHPGISVPDLPHLLALFYQARRAWYFPSRMIFGASPSVQAARLDLWHANMGDKVCLYAKSLYHQMDTVPVLITGESGTGKELAATVIAWSRFIPFDEATRRFARTYDDDFHVKNLSEVPPELVPSTLFGHKRGAFTGAVADSLGLLALPRPYGTLFLDEFGDIAPHVQAQLLRPVADRRYSRVGDTALLTMHGRIVSATNRDVWTMAHDGRFREDLLERMNGYPIHMPPLRQMLAEDPRELETYVRAFVAARFVAAKLPAADVDAEADRVMSTLQAERPGYAWPRNVRELKNEIGHCVMGKKPAPLPAPAAPAPAPVVPPSPPAGSTRTPATTCPPSSYQRLVQRAMAGQATVKELQRATVTWTHVLTGRNTSETARRMGIDRKTVYRLLDMDRLVRWLKGRK